MGKRSNETKEERRERKRLKKEHKKAKKQKKERKKEKASSAEAAVSETSTHVVEANPVFFRKEVDVDLALLPSRLIDVETHVENSMRSFLLEYSDGFGGVPLALEKVEILPQSEIAGAAAVPVGMVFNELPYIHFKVRAHALVFDPTSGCNLRGRVSASFHSHLSLLVFGYFNASISAQEMQQAGFSFDETEMQWYRKESDDAETTKLEFLRPDSELEFVCNRVFESAGIISIDGIKPRLSHR